MSTAGRISAQNVNKGEARTAEAVASVSPFAAAPAQLFKTGTFIPVPPSNTASKLAERYNDAEDQQQGVVIPQIQVSQEDQIRILQDQIAKLSAAPAFTPDPLELPPLADFDEPEVKAENPIQEFRSPAGLPSYRCEFDGRQIFVGFPCYKTTNPVTAFVLLALALDFGRDKIRFDMQIGDAMIYHSRNRIAQKFLETDAKWLLQLDDDIIPCIGRPGWMRTWVPTAKTVADIPLQRHILHRLVGSGKSIVGGAYFGRQHNAPLIAHDPTSTLSGKARSFSDEVVPVDWVGTGCLLTHRSVFEAIMKTFPELAPKTAGAPFNFFQPLDSERGEDVSFCLRAKKAGHQPHIDLGTPVYHVGYHVYGAN